jgi:hypothetical protein
MRFVYATAMLFAVGWAHACTATVKCDSRGAVSDRAFCGCQNRWRFCHTKTGEKRTLNVKLSNALLQAFDFDGVIEGCRAGLQYEGPSDGRAPIPLPRL